MKRLSKVVLGLFAMSTLLMAQQANVAVKLKAVQTVLINAGNHSVTSGTAGIGQNGSNVLDFGTYIVGDTGSLEANATIYFDNVDLKTNTLNISIPESINLSAEGGSNVAVNLDLDKTSIHNENQGDEGATVNLHGVIPNARLIEIAGNYTGTVPVTIALN